jgi:hypothetical protein
MFHQNVRGSRNHRPVEHRDVVIVAGRVVKVRTQHVSSAIWLATGTVSERLPSGPQLASPLEVSATGATEEQAIEALKRRVEEFNYHVGD